MDRQTSKVSAVGYRNAFKLHAGRKVRTLQGAMQREATAPQPCPLTSTATAKHAAVRVESRDRKRPEQLNRCITRPALSHERVRLHAAGQVELKLTTPWRYGTTHLAMSPIEFMQRLAALVQRQQLHPPMTALRL